MFFIIRDKVYFIRLYARSVSFAETLGKLGRKELLSFRSVFDDFDHNSPFGASVSTANDLTENLQRHHWFVNSNTIWYFSVSKFLIAV
jgi:hypothetical protein